MDEKKVISQLKRMQKIQPSKDWVASVKRDIVGEEISAWNLIARPVLSTGVAFSFIAFLFVSAQNTVPGDALYSLKKVTENSQRVLSADKAQFELNLAQKKMADLSRVSAENRSRGITELEITKGRVEKELSHSISQRTPEQAAKLAREVAPTLISLNEVLTNHALEQEEVVSSDKFLAELLIKDLETRTLTLEQEEILSEAKTNLEEKDYFLALKKVMEIEEEVVEEN